MSRKKNTPENRQEAIRLWGCGNGVATISEMMGINRNLVSRMLREEGVDCSVKSSSANTLYKGNIRDIFSERNEDNDYFLGFFLADGCVRDDKVSIELQRRDSKIVCELVRILGMDIRINNNDRKCGNKTTSFSVRSGILASELNRYNIFPNKTGFESAPDVLIGSRDFWRGVVDGDGCITIPKNNHPRIYLCGTEELCNQFLDYCLTVDPEIRSKVNPTQNIFRVTITGNRAMNIMDNLYKDSSIRLERKFNKYEESKKFYEDKHSNSR